jgi:N4-gp56 family major capsid protein
MSTVVGLNDAKARKLWSTNLVVSIAAESYWQRKYMGAGEETMQPVMLLTDLEREAGQQIQYDLSLQIGGEPAEGDTKVEGTGEQLRFASDSVYINQARKAVSCGGRMTRKRTVHDLRKIGRNRLKEYWARLFDEQFFMYAAAARGINPDFNFGLGYTGRANNAFQAPDSAHLLHGDGTSKATLTSAGVMSRALIERANTKVATQDLAEIQPIRIGGAEHNVLVMHPFQFHSLKTSTATNDWMDIYKALATAEGKNNPIFVGGEGMIGGTILHKHKKVIRFSDYGAGTNLPAARALFLGRQALVCAFGSPGGGLRMSWSEKELDHGNDIEIAAGAIFGIKKNQFDSKDFGMLSLDTYAADPG